jgi:hypothetical protein
VIKFIYDNLSKLGPLGQRKMLDLHLIGTHHSTDGGELRDEESSIPKLVSVLDNATVLEAVQLMVTQSTRERERARARERYTQYISNLVTL